MGALFYVRSCQEAACEVEGGEVEGVGGELEVGDDVVLDGERELHPTPFELGAALGGEGLPTAILPLGRSKLLVEGADLRKLDYFRKVSIRRTSRVFRLESLAQMRHNAFGGDRRVELREVDHPAAHRSDAVFLQLGGLGLEVALQVVHVAADEDGAVMQVLMAAFAEGVAAEFTAVGEDVVSPRQLGDDAEIKHGALYDAELTRLVVESFGDDEREVDVAVVVIHRSAAGTAPHEVAAVGLEGLDVALAKWILVLSDDDGATVAPQVERHGVGLGEREEVVLDGNVPIGICLVGYDELQFH